jgi:glycerol-3-phosphate dehydrogenase
LTTIQHLESPGRTALSSCMNTMLATPLTHEDIDGVYARLRPLPAGESDDTSKQSREHTVACRRRGWPPSPTGEYTTDRVTSADANDAAAEFIPARLAPSITEKVPLVGVDGYSALINQLTERLSYIAEWGGQLVFPLPTLHAAAIREPRKQ